MMTQAHSKERFAGNKLSFLDGWNEQAQERTPASVPPVLPIASQEKQHTKLARFPVTGHSVLRPLLCREAHYLTWLFS